MNSNFICFDTEDNSKELLMAGKSGFDKEVTQIAGITQSGKTYYSKGNVKGFLKWLLQRPEQFIYAHNVQYDLGNLFGDTIDALDIVTVGGRLIRAAWKNKIFLDTFNIWPMSAKKLGEKFGVKKLALDVYSKEYVFRDVEIIHAAMKFVWEITGYMGLQKCPATLGGLAVKVWRQWGGENVHDSHILSRQALYGGRVELFKAESESDSVCYTDINSLYPYVMTFDFPAELKETRKMLAHGITTVTIKLPETELALLPFRSVDGRIYYPYGKITGTWTNIELHHAEENGAKILKVHESIGTNDTIQPYKYFVDKLYNLRVNSTSEAEKLFYKLLMNNLYGRLSVSGKIGRSVYRTPESEKKGVPYGEKVHVEYSLPLSTETNWSHGSYVTAYGRIELFKAMQAIATKHLIYCDTDSTIFDWPRKKPLPFKCGDKLGQMKLVAWQSLCMTYAPKMYRTDDEYKAKGVPRQLAKQYIETGRAEFDLPFRLRESILFFDRQNVKKLSVWRKIIKIRHDNYDRKSLKKNRFFPLAIA